MGFFSNNGFKTSSRNGEENPIKKMDRQLEGQTSSTPFMSIKEGFGKRVTFNMTEGIEQKIEKLMVMMGNFVMKDEGQNRPFKPQV